MSTVPLVLLGAAVTAFVGLFCDVDVVSRCGGETPGSTDAATSAAAAVTVAVVEVTMVVEIVFTLFGIDITGLSVAHSTQLALMSLFIGHSA